MACLAAPAARVLRHLMRDAGFMRGHAQLTDIYLRGFAVGMRGRLATFDSTIPRAAVRGASRDDLEAIAPSD
jgi:hypothetical protein